MFTVCPKCTLTLVVTTVDLRAGQGYVRCGRCANVFNALIALREGEPGGSAGDSATRRLLETAPKESRAEDIQPAFGAGVAVDPEPESTPEPEPEPAPELEPQPEFKSATATESESESESEPEPEQLSDDASMEFDAAATDVSEIFIPPPDDDEGSGNYEAVVLQEEPISELEAEAALELESVETSPTDTIASDDWSLLDDPDMPAADSTVEAASSIETPTEAANESDPAWVQEMFAEAEAEAERVKTAEHELFAPEDAALDDQPPAEVELGSGQEFTEFEPEPEPPAPTEPTEPTEEQLQPLLRGQRNLRPSWQYMGGLAALSLLLFAQIIHYNRQDLALSNSFGPMASRVYGWFGVTLVPRWDLTAYAVKQLGAETEGGEGTRLRVRLSVHNESSRVQPLPLLRLTLQDRFGNAVATRDLEPSDYLPQSAANRRLLEPDQRIDAELHVIDPGKAAVGFEIDACLRGAGGNLGCANEARRRAAG